MVRSITFLYECTKGRSGFKWVLKFQKSYQIFPKTIGRKIVNASKTREDSDYDDEYEPDAEETEIQMKTAEELIELVEKYINEKI